MAFERKPVTQAISIDNMVITTGTWARTYASGIRYWLKTATAETSTVDIPIALPARADSIGYRLNSVVIPVRITTADLSGAPTVALHRVNYFKALSDATVDIDANAITQTYDGVVTADANDRLTTVTVTSPADTVVATGESQTLGGLIVFNLRLSLPCAASTVVRVYDALARFETVT